jgi:septum formation protein
MTVSPEIVLASASPRRRELLERVGVPIAVVPSRTPEEVLPGETPEEHVIRLSKDKAREVAGRPEVPGRWFVGSDTIVLRDEAILGKPKDTEDAALMLRSLSGRPHRVLSGYAVFDRRSGATVAGVVSTLVRFKELTEEEIAGYIATGEPLDKAGAYAIQGIGAFMVLGIEGSYTNVVGLPLCEVVEVLERLGAVRLFSR